MTRRQLDQRNEEIQQLNRAAANAAGFGSSTSSAIESDIQEQIATRLRADRELEQIMATDQSEAVKAGFAAEVAHKESFNLDANAKGQSVRAYNDNDGQFSQHGYRKNDPSADLITVRDGQVSQKAQVKYYKDPEKTANALREQRPDGSPKYHDTDQHIVPADQVEGVKEAGHRTKLKNQGNRPQVANAAEEVEQKATATLKDGKVSSAAISKKDAEQLGKHGNNQRRQNYQTQAENQAIWRNSTEAMKAGAASASIIAGASNTLLYLNQVRQGKLSGEEAVAKICSNTLCTAADATIKAGAITAVTGKLAAKQLIQQGMKGILTKNAATGAVICTVDLVKDLVKVAQGKLEAKELAGRATKTGLNVMAGATTFELGKMLAVGLGAASSGFLPAAAGIACSLIVTSGLNMAIENGIEKPFRMLTENTANLQQALASLEQTAQRMAVGQQLFSDSLEQSKEFDQEFERIQHSSKQATIGLRNAIDRLAKPTTTAKQQWNNIEQSSKQATIDLRNAIDNLAPKK